jgi:hypothetical protein
VLCRAACRLGELPVLVGRDYAVAVEGEGDGGDGEGEGEGEGEVVRVLALLVPVLHGESADGGTDVAAAARALEAVGPTLALVRWFEPLQGDRAVDEATECTAYELRPLGAFARLVSVRSLTGPVSMEHLCTGSCKQDTDTGATLHSASQLFARNRYAWNTVFRA